MEEKQEKAFVYDALTKGMGGETIRETTDKAGSGSLSQY